MIKLNTQQKAILSSYYPELREWLDQREQAQSNSALDSLVVALIGKIQSVKGEKGEKGYTPIKGKDYFTDQEVNQLITYVLKQATPVKGVHYKDGEKGDAYILTNKDKREIASQIEVPVVDKIVERTEIIKEVSKSLDVSDIKGAVSKKELEIHGKKILDGMALVDGRIKLIDQRWRGGGGLNKVTTDSSLTGLGTPSSPLKVVGGGGGIWYQDEVLTRSDGTNYTLAHTPTAVVFLFLNGQLLISGTDYTRTGTAITMTSPTLSTDVLIATYQ